MFPILKQSLGIIFDQFLALLNKLQGGQERVVLSTVMQLFMCLQKCRVKADQIEYPGYQPRLIDIESSARTLSSW
jgi:hypothetical protein